MFRTFVLTLALGAACIPFSAAHAGVYSDDLGKCMVRHMSGPDQIILVRAVFASMAEHPDIKPYTSLTDDQRKQFVSGFGDLMVRLMVDSCHKESVAALKYEGSPAITQAFTLLGQVAMRGLMSDPHVEESLQNMKIDEAKLNALAKEAGIPVPGDTSGGDQAK